MQAQAEFYTPAGFFVSFRYMKVPIAAGTGTLLQRSSGYNWSFCFIVFFTALFMTFIVDYICTVANVMYSVAVTFSINYKQKETYVF